MTSSPKHGAGKHYISQHWGDFSNYYWLNYKPIVYSELKNSTILWTKTQVIGRYSFQGDLIIPSEVDDHQHDTLKYLIWSPHSEREHLKQEREDTHCQWHYCRWQVGTLSDYEHITRLIIIAFAYIATLLIKHHINNDNFLYK